MSIANRVARGNPGAASVMTAAPDASAPKDSALPTSGRRQGPAPAAAPCDATSVACWTLVEIQRLREENELLRESAHSFGALAERLYLRLREREVLAGRDRGGRDESAR